MFGFGKKFIQYDDNDILLSESSVSLRKNVLFNGVMHFGVDVPTVIVRYEREYVRGFKIDTLDTNPSLVGQYFHFSVAINVHGSVSIEGVLSADANTVPHDGTEGLEKIRFQPFFLPYVRSAIQQESIGKGVFQRGLYVPGYMTPSWVRVICTCDHCEKSFTVRHFHAGYSQLDYYYSDDSKQTLVVDQAEFRPMFDPTWTMDNEEYLRLVEPQLPLPTIGTGRFRYYNPFRCPHCLHPFLDYATYKDQRRADHYGLYHINSTTYHLKDLV